MLRNAGCLRRALRAALQTKGVEFTTGDQPDVTLRKADDGIF
jgi:hypothetical protein